MLTEAEANEISQDSRVLACELNPLDQGIEFVPLWTQTGDFEKQDQILKVMIKTGVFIVYKRRYCIELGN